MIFRSKNSVLKNLLFILPFLILSGCSQKSSKPTISSHISQKQSDSIEDEKTQKSDSQLPKSEIKTPLNYHEKVQKIYSALDLALDILYKARLNSNDNPTLQSEFTKITKVLSKTFLMIPEEGENFNNCSFGVMAFTVPSHKNKLGICRVLLETSEDYIAQTIIHESAHLSGHWDECKATELEINAMRKGSKIKPYENDYVTKCGFFI